MTSNCTSQVDTDTDLDLDLDIDPDTDNEPDNDIDTDTDIDIGTDSDILRPPPAILPFSFRHLRLNQLYFFSQSPVYIRQCASWTVIHFFSCDLLSFGKLRIWYYGVFKLGCCLT